jgi:hypothetical protein
LSKLVGWYVLVSNARSTEKTIAGLICMMKNRMPPMTVQKVIDMVRHRDESYGARIAC